jgi:phenylalanyl-tRNA synthetase beta chain
VKNERNFDEFDIFEEAQIFLDSDYTSEYKGESLPCQQKHLGCAFVGKSDDISSLFRKAKGVIEAMPRYTHMEAFTLKKVEKPYWADNVVWMNIFLGDEKIGDIALLSKKAALACGIKVLSAVLVELNMDALKPFKSRTNQYVRIPEFPMIDYDISFLVDSSVKWSDIYESIIGKKSDAALLRDACFVDEYKGKQVPDGKKSVTIRLVIGSKEKTLTSAGIENVASSAIKKLVKAFGAEVRGK